MNEQDRIISQQHLLKMALCKHESRTGGNDYLLCNACDLMWDYRRQSASEALVDLIVEHCKTHGELLRPDAKDYGKDLVDAMNEDRWKDAVELLIWKVDGIYKELAQTRSVFTATAAELKPVYEMMSHDAFGCSERGQAVYAFVMRMGKWLNDHAS